MEIWQAVVLGLVEGITEFLPISSTGHLILASHFLGLTDPAHKPAIDAFNIVVQGGAILAVAGVYWPRCVQMLRGLMGKDAAGLRLLVNLGIAFLPAAVLGLLLERWLERHLFFPVPVLAAVLLGGLFMFAMDAWKAGRIAGRFGPADAATRNAEIDSVRPGQALAIGLFQCVAMWPGVSRSMMGIAGGMLCGLRPRAAAEFAFLLGLPTLGGATVYKLVKNLSQSDANGNLFQQLGIAPVLVGMGVAAISAAISVKWLVGFLNRHGLSAFGWYRVGLFVVLLVLVAVGGLKIGQ